MNPVVAEAMTWLRTPYHPRGRVKGHGVDCVTFPVLVYAAVYGKEPSVPAKYSVQWHMHHDEEKYLAHVLEYADPIDSPEPGDFVLWRFGRAFSHGGIIIDWPLVIHAHMENGVTLDDADAAGIFKMKNGDLRERKFFRPRAA